MRPPGEVVALEFTGLGPDQAFDQLLGPGCGVRVDPLDLLAEQPLSLPEHAARLSSRLTVPPRVVLGHCTAARLAVALAASAAPARSGSPPLVVLLDPDPVSAGYVGAEFTRLCATLGGQPDSPPPPGAPGADSLAVMEDQLARLARAQQVAFGDDEAAAELAGELVSRYAAWLRFLAAGASADPIDFGGEIIAITSGSAGHHLAPIARPVQVSWLPGCATDGSALLTSLLARRAVQHILQTGRLCCAGPAGSHDPQPTMERCAAHAKPSAPRN